MSEPAAYACPHCGAIVEISALSTAQFITCDRCGGEFEVPALESEISPADALDGLRIRQVAAARRAANRIRSYYVIAAATCFVVAIQLAWMACQRIRAYGAGLSAVAEIGFAGVAVYGTFVLGRHIFLLGRNLKNSVLINPLAPPDVSSLGDGSEQWKRLDDVR